MAFWNIGFFLIVKTFIANFINLKCIYELRIGKADIPLFKLL